MISFLCTNKDILEKNKELSCLIDSYQEEIIEAILKSIKKQSKEVELSENKMNEIISDDFPFVSPEDNPYLKTMISNIFFQLSQIENGVLKNGKYDYYEKRGINDDKYNVSDSEKKSWIYELYYLYSLFDNEEFPANIGNIGVAFETILNYENTRRIDVMIGGTDEEGKKNIVLIEFKRWNKGGGSSHPIEALRQAEDYAIDIELNNQKTYPLNRQEDNVAIRPCAYLHDYDKPDNVPDEIYFKNEIDRLRKDIKGIIGCGEGLSVFWEFENGQPQNSLTLHSNCYDIINRKTNITLRGDQYFAYKRIMNRIINHYKNKINEREIIAVVGGPGSGKTALAMRIWAEVRSIYKDKSFYVMQSKAPKRAYSTDISKKDSDNQNDVIKIEEEYFPYVNKIKSENGVFLCDECHRFGVQDIKSVIGENGVFILFFDEMQKTEDEDADLQIKDKKKLIFGKFGNSEEQNEIELDATFHLYSQFRCGCDNGYLSWLDEILESKASDRKPRFRIQILSREDVISKLNEGKCIILGSDEDATKEFCEDFSLPFHRITEDEAFVFTEESSVGGVFDIQGLEVDRAIVVIGNDVCLSDDKLCFKGILTRNKYRILLTRAMKECYIYCKNDEIVEFLSSRNVDCYVPPEYGKKEC